ncbi:MAG TPA: hypothetical protein VII46_07375, partial [Acidimicrobiales bacterium]
MGPRIRTLLRSRATLPLALVGSVGIVGLLAFSPAAAQADVNAPATPISVPTTTLPKLTTTATTVAPIVHATAVSPSGAIA